MTRNEYDIEMCWDEETNEFDWDEYQYLCDIADYCGCEEQKGITYGNGRLRCYRLERWKVSFN